MTEEKRYLELERAACRYAEVEIERLARKVVYQLVRFPASGIFKGEICARSLWDEYCYEIQHGPHDLLEWAWDLTIDPFVEDALSRQRDELVDLLTAVADFYEDSLAVLLKFQLNTYAGDRNIDGLIDD